MFWCDCFVRVVTLLLISESNVCASFYPEENSITNLRNDDMVDVLVHLAQIKGMIDSIDEKLNSLDRKLDQRVTALDQTIGSLDQRFNSLDKGMLELNVRLQLDTFKTELQDIRGACNRLLETSVAETTPYPVSPKPATTFQITRVTKEDTGGTFQVRVEYEASSPPSAILLNVDSNELVTKLEEQNFGVVEFEVPNNEGTSVNTRFERTLLHFIIKEQVHVAMLNLYSTPDVMLAPAIQFQVEQGSDVIFQPGRDVVIDLTLKVEGDPDHLSRDDFSFKWIMKDNLAENKLNRYRLYSVESPIMTHMKVDGELGNGHAKITVLSRSDRESEGILDIYGDVSFNCSRNCLLDKAQSHVSVQLRREDRPGPLTEGFLGFIHDDQKGDPSNVG
ncbi:uncharacterized protein [Littorina saxatilis]|uniref:uncharacterized protein n=1 Tax=Littorina saxatilis TaxID=31220 RepID=UPI0038B4CDB2